MKQKILDKFPYCPCGKNPNPTQQELVEHIYCCKTYSDMLIKDYGAKQVIETLQEMCADYIEFTKRAAKLIDGKFCKCKNPITSNMHKSSRKFCMGCYLVIKNT